MSTFFKDKLEIQTSTEKFTYGSWDQDPGRTRNSFSGEGLLVPVISAERKQVDEKFNSDTSSPPSPKKDGILLDSPEKHQNMVFIIFIDFRNVNLNNKLS